MSMCSIRRGEKASWCHHTGELAAALPNGQSLGPMPASLHQRFIDLNQKFADGWRVTNATTLFDYSLVRAQ